MFLYNLTVRAYGMVIWLASLGNHKAALWVLGRKNWRKRLNNGVHLLGEAKRIWVHCASYGEFEQGRPLIEAVKVQYPDLKIVLSFFSPSGYEHFKNWKGADLICYLPLDTKKNAQDFITVVKPQAAVFVKYEFWVNFLFTLKKENIPAFLVSAVFKPHHPFFKWYGALFRKSLNTFSRLFIQDDLSGSLLESIGINHFEISGDTRFDRVLAIKQNFKPLPFFEEMCYGRQVIVAGSTWPADEEILLKTYQQFAGQGLLLMLIPHHVNEKNIALLQQKIIKNNLSYTLYSGGIVNTAAQVLVVDAMGLLSQLYYYASVAYIGGGFDSGIHNCLEPAVYFKPVVFYGGTDYKKYNEAIDMLEMGTAHNIHNGEELETSINAFLSDSQLIAWVEKKQESYFAQKAGTTQKILDLLNW